jgi:hypothetical protein
MGKSFKIRGVPHKRECRATKTKRNYESAREQEREKKGHKEIGLYDDGDAH